ncbi:hypothetical protein SCLCIDRAFT_1213427 [Scleroderma citrinum Foug A]|uniref:Uncharacterized protein n=1 Tax=Scleroderma citrinum Foug A TaxID=1036808 RepID=A0A0C3E8K8_9AGAM|nr:hypothetical protein SCLCIDRAFT_1213427 [Scleroderma citrinum Foug A]
MPPFCRPPAHKTLINQKGPALYHHNYTSTIPIEQQCRSFVITSSVKGGMETV